MMPGKSKPQIRLGEYDQQHQLTENTDAFIISSIQEYNELPQSSEERIISAIREENKALRDEIATLNGRLTWLTETVVEMKELLYKRPHSQAFEPSDFNFPLRTEFDLQFIDKEIGESSSFKNECISEMKSLFSHKTLSKTLPSVMAVELILDFNIEGVHNKKGLRSYAFFFSALIDAIWMNDNSQPPVKTLQKAMQCVKNNACKKRTRAEELKCKKEEKIKD